MADLLSVTDTFGVQLRDVMAAHGVELQPDALVMFGMQCEQCGDFFEAECSAEFLDLYGVLCDGHRCLKA